MSIRLDFSSIMSFIMLKEHSTCSAVNVDKVDFTIAERYG